MAMHIVPTRDQVRAAVDQARRDAAHDVRWTRAINRAWDRLQLRGWLWNGTTLRMFSSDGMSTYTVTPHTCECRAYTEFHQPCLHRAAAKLLLNAVGFESKIETVVRVSPAEAANDALNERATDADYQAYTDALNEEF